MPKYLPRLKVFDTGKAFQLEDAINLESTGAAGERVTIGVVDGAVFVAYLATDSEAIHVRKLEWHTAPAGWAPTTCP